MGSLSSKPASVPSSAGGASMRRAVPVAFVGRLISSSGSNAGDGLRLPPNLTVPEGPSMLQPPDSAECRSTPRAVSTSISSPLGRTARTDGSCATLSSTLTRRAARPAERIMKNVSRLSDPSGRPGASARSRSPPDRWTRKRRSPATTSSTIGPGADGSKRSTAPTNSLDSDKASGAHTPGISTDTSPVKCHGSSSRCSSRVAIST